LELYFLVVTAHVLAALVWLGGMLFLALAASELRRIDDDALRAQLFDRLGRRFRLVGWICIVVLVGTGVAQLQMRQWWGLAVWTRPGFWTSATGGALAWKLSLAFVMIGIQGLHDFWLGPRAGSAPRGSEEARSLRKRAAHLARINALLGLGLVYVAIRLARGG